MANGLKRIAEILPEVWKDLEEFNRRFDERERANGRVDVLPTSDAGTIRDRDGTTGESK